VKLGEQLLVIRKVLRLTRDISRGRQLGPRWHDGNTAQHEEHLQNEQQKVHDRSPVSSG
jgi:hypothetical protein